MTNNKDRNSSSDSFLGNGNQATRRTISDQEVRRRIAEKAYELYERRGRVPGRDVEDWLEAARMVMAELASREASQPRPDCLEICFEQYEFDVKLFFRE